MRTDLTPLVAGEDVHSALEAGRDLALREAVYLDEQRWDEWLALYTADCEYWVPTWRNDDELTDDPQRELSHVYYANRGGLEDRILRIRSRRSPAGSPLRRTTHVIGNVMLRDPAGADPVVRCSWNCHVFEVLHRRTYVFFGHADYRLRMEGNQWLIAAKKTVLQNDYLPSGRDSYCI